MVPMHKVSPGTAQARARSITSGSALDLLDCLCCKRAQLTSWRLATFHVGSTAGDSLALPGLDEHGGLVNQDDNDVREFAYDADAEGTGMRTCARASRVSAAHPARVRALRLVASLPSQQTSRRRRSDTSSSQSPAARMCLPMQRVSERADARVPAPPALSHTT